jgi:hypothetical protein
LLNHGQLFDFLGSKVVLGGVLLLLNGLVILLELRPCLCELFLKSQAACSRCLRLWLLLLHLNCWADDWNATLWLWPWRGLDKSLDINCCLCLLLLLRNLLLYHWLWSGLNLSLRDLGLLNLLNRRSHLWSYWSSYWSWLQHWLLGMDRDIPIVGDLMTNSRLSLNLTNWLKHFSGI